MDKVELHNGDCSVILKQLVENNTKVNAIVTDPPYGVEFKNSFYNDSLDYVLDNMKSWYESWYELLEDDGFLFAYVGVKTLHLWIQEGIECGFTFKNVLATRSFNNGSPTPKNNFGFQFQPIIVFSKGRGRNFNEVDLIPTSLEWFKDKRNKNPKPFTYAYPNFIKSDWAFATVKSSTKNVHPNEKNHELLKFLIEVSTNENDIVLDPFMGSGSTGISSKKTNRRFIGIEKDENYFNIAKERINAVI